LKPKFDEPLSNVAFSFNVRRYAAVLTNGGADPDLYDFLEVVGKAVDTCIQTIGVSQNARSWCSAPRPTSPHLACTSPAL
jgi:hypothetical protein